MFMRGRFGSLQVLSAFFLSGALLAGAAVAAYAQVAQTFSVHEVNFAIEGAPTSVRAGAPLTYNVTAEGFPHNLAIDGNGVDLRPSTPNIQNGTGTVSFPALQPGTYHLYCPVGQHRQNGMDVTFTVVAGAAALPATGGAAGLPLPLALTGAGLISGAAGILWRRR
jgi:plastocyanin